METLETKLTQLDIAVKRAGKVLDAGKRETINRHLETLQNIIKEANESKSTVEAQKISDKEDLSKIDEWNVGVETKLETADIEVALLGQWLAENERNEKFLVQEEFFKLEIRMHEEKLELRAELSATEKQEPSECETLERKLAKLPKPQSPYQQINVPVRTARTQG